MLVVLASSDVLLAGGEACLNPLRRVLRVALCTLRSLRICLRFLAAIEILLQHDQLLRLIGPLPMSIPVCIGELLCAS